MGYIPKWEHLQRMTDEELIAKYNAEADNTVVGTDFYQDQILRRALERSSAAAHALAEAALEEARQARRLAFWNMIVALVAVATSALTPLLIS
jgi:hypothetical protein